MEKIDKIKIPIYCGDTLVHYQQCYVLDKIPMQEDYIEIDNLKGYVVDVQTDDDIKEQDYIIYTIYYENEKGDWYDRQIDCNVLYIAIHR